MKKILSILAVGLVALACNPVEDIPTLEVSMTSFSFTAENNPDVIKTDIVVSEPENSIKITLPYGTDEAALTSLVPSFVVTEGASVAGDDQAVVSGETAVDFTYPVEFLVTLNAKSNAQYTVTVDLGQPESFAFAASGAAEDVLDKGPYLAINPKDNMPYFAAVLDNEVSDNKYPALYKYDGSAISKICNVAELRADQPVVAFTPEGTPYFAFYNYGAKFVNVYSIGGTTPTAVGELDKLYRPLTNSYYSTIGLCPLSETDVYIGYGVNTASGSLAKRTLNLAQFKNASWTQELAIAGRNASDYGYEVFGKMVGNIGYMLVFNQNTQTLSLYKLTASGVSTVFESLAFDKISAEATETPVATKINLYGLSFDIASNGDPYMILNGEFSTVTSGYSPAVFRYNVAAAKAELVGGVMADLDGQAARFVSLALDANDVPYVAYRNPETNCATYRYIDAKTKVWTAPQALSADEAENITIAFAEDGTGYISYLNVTQDVNTVSLYKTK